MTPGFLSNTRQKITVLGAGAWGTALAIRLAARHDVVLWGRRAAAVAAMHAARENTRYLAGCLFPPALRVTADFGAAVGHVADAAADDAPLLFVACPVAGLRALMGQLKHHALPNVLALCKGFERNTGLLPHQVMQEVLGDAVAVGVLSGPSFALEVARASPCALTVASACATLRKRVIDAAHGGVLRVYATDDMIGVEVGGAAKNIIAIATGVADGLDMGLNARAALMTRGLAEITRLGLALGARAETFAGLAGMGDLILTCTGDLSRNRRVGLSLARGLALDRIVAELGHVAEGIPCTESARGLAGKLGVDLPITSAVASLLFDGAGATAVAERLLAREVQFESA